MLPLERVRDPAPVLRSTPDPEIIPLKTRALPLSLMVAVPDKRLIALLSVALVIPLRVVPLDMVNVPVPRGPIEEPLEVLNTMVPVERVVPPE